MPLFFPRGAAAGLDRLLGRHGHRGPAAGGRDPALTLTVPGRCRLWAGSRRSSLVPCSTAPFFKYAPGNVPELEPNGFRRGAAWGAEGRARVDRCRQRDQQLPLSDFGSGAPCTTSASNSSGCGRPTTARGSTSFVLYAAGLRGEIGADSTASRATTASGAGKWITIYADADHVHIVVDGYNFDTVPEARARLRISALGGPRWVLRTTAQRSTMVRDFIVSHPPGLLMPGRGRFGVCSAKAASASIWSSGRWSSSSWGPRSWSAAAPARSASRRARPPPRRRASRGPISLTWTAGCRRARCRMRAIGCGRSRGGAPPIPAAARKGTLELAGMRLNDVAGR